MGNISLSGELELVKHHANDSLLENKNYKFSVVIPIYIHEKDSELRMAFNSVINQTLVPNEILIIADKDIPQNTINILEEYKSKYSEIFNYLILKEDAYLGKALSIGVINSKYNIIARMDCDDIANNTRFEKQIKFMQENPDIDVVGSWITEFENTPDNIYAKRILPTTNKEIYKYCKFRCPMNHMTVMFKKQAVLDAGNYKNLKRMEDFELWARMLFKGYKFANLSEYLVNVRAGQDLINRRSGFSEFIKHEYTLFKGFYKMGFINFNEFFKAISTKFLLRTIPNWLRKFIYNNFLHKKVKRG